MMLSMLTRCGEVRGIANSAVFICIGGTLLGEIMDFAPWTSFRASLRTSMAIVADLDCQLRL